MALLNERALQSAVIELAQLLGWKVAHFRPAQTSRGWRTPVEGDGKGFPDLVLVRRGRIIFAELKAAKGKVSAEQAGWLAWLKEATDNVYVWRPEDWDDGSIERKLR